MAFPSKTIELIERMAERLEAWANDKKRHRMLCYGLAGLGCRSSLSEPLRGFGTILLKLKCWRPEAAQEVEKGHIRLLSSAKEIDQEIKNGRRGFVFSASAVQVSASLLAKKLRVVAEMAGEDLSVEKQKDERRSKKKPRKPKPINERLTFGQGQVLFDGRDLNVGTGAALDITKALIEDFGQVVPFQTLDGNSPQKEASEKIRTAIGRIRRIIKSAKIPVVVDNRKGEGYLMRPSTK
jgi:hypothetical protein